MTDVSKTNENVPTTEAKGTSKPIAEKVEIWDIDGLIPSARNVRTHSAAQVAEIAGSIVAFGFIVPIIVDRDGNVLAGNGRLLAARKLKLDRVPVIVVDHLSDSEKRAYAIADNKIALNAEWNDELLCVELDALKNEGINLESLGFSEQEFNKLLDQLRPDPKSDEDSVPDAPAVPTCRTGDLWELADHLLFCGDALDSTSYAALLGGEPAAMTFGDLPYNVGYLAPGLGVRIANDNLGEKFGPFLDKACAQILANTRGGIYIAMASSELHTLFSAFTKAGGHWSTFAIWGKNTFTLGHADYQRQFEPILYGWREGQPHYWCSARDQGDLWLIDRPQVNDLHPTMKPIALMERAIINSSQRGETVLDPFAGSGSTLIACEKTGRKARLIELEPKYCDVIIQRWQDFTGHQAVHKETGKTFADVAAERLVAPPLLPEVTSEVA